MDERPSEFGTVFLIPTTLGPGAEAGSLPPATLEHLHRLTHFAAEDPRTARRFLKRTGFSGALQELEFHRLDKHTSRRETTDLLDIVLKGEDLGVLSEGGCPGIADPGGDLVAAAHQRGLRVVPLVGPCSFVLALMGSGMNGQRFAFKGYLPHDDEKRKAQIQLMERIARHETQIFMETPYRSQKLLDELIAQLRPETQLCVACDLTTPHEMIRSAPIAWWKKEKMDLTKHPCVFLIGPQLSPSEATPAATKSKKTEKRPKKTRAARK